MRVSNGTTASCAVGIRWKMAKPSTFPVECTCALPSEAGSAGLTCVVAIQVALGAMVLSTEDAIQSIRSHGLLGESQGQRQRTGAGGVGGVAE